jgi:prepilin-type N-terminal cleavage/methylation domain-containing protein
MIKKGFTIIELIVAVAIIAVLATIVAANVIQYIPKGKNAAIKAQMKQIPNAATDFFYTNSTYVGMCGLGTKCAQVTANIQGLGGSAGANNLTATGYCLVFYLSDGLSTWCIDNTGYAGSLANCNPSSLPPNATCQ